MSDLFALALGMAFSAATWGLVVLCEKLMGGGK
jgi:hypothetical protein